MRLPAQRDAARSSPGATWWMAPSPTRGFVVALTTSDHVMHVWCSNEADFLTLVTGPLKAWLQLAGHRP